LEFWTMYYRDFTSVSGKVFAGGWPRGQLRDRVEDYAIATLDLSTGVAVRIACSWRLHAGRDAMISAAFYGTDGGAALRNVEGSFYDFTAERYRGTAREVLADRPDDWGGRAAVYWATRLVDDPSFDPGAERLVDIADVLDRIYDR
jgi:predicted dehydrogenase